VVRDHPKQASWMRQESCGWLERELDREQETLPSVKNLAATLHIPGVILLCVQFFCWSVGVYGLVLWLPTMIREGSSQGIEAVGFLNAAPFLLAVILMVAVAYFSDRSLNLRNCAAGLVPTGGPQLLAGVCVSDCCRRHHVRALRAVLLDHAGDAAQERGGRGNRPSE
jgi:hypothetical protein